MEYDHGPPLTGGIDGTIGPQEPERRLTFEGLALLVESEIQDVHRGADSRPRLERRDHAQNGERGWQEEARVPPRARVPIDDANAITRNDCEVMRAFTRLESGPSSCWISER